MAKLAEVAALKMTSVVGVRAPVEGASPARSVAKLAEFVQRELRGLAAPVQ